MARHSVRAETGPEIQGHLRQTARMERRALPRSAKMRTAASLEYE